MSELLPQAGIAGAGLWAIHKTIGPSLAAFGDSLGSWTKYRMDNLLKINEKVAKRLDPNEDSPADEAVHPRVVKTILEDGSWIDNELHQEYLAGLLVRSRNSGGANDAQTYLASIVTKLTGDQIALHYAIVTAYAGMWDGTGVCPFPLDRRDKYRTKSVIVPNEQVVSLVNNFPIAAKGLIREGLLADYGRPIAGSHIDTHQVFVVTPLAFDIYLQAMAKPNVGAAGLMLERARVANFFYEPNPDPPRFTEVIIDDPGG